MAAEDKKSETKQLQGWRRQRGEVLQRIEQLKRRGVCYICHDLKTQQVFGEQETIYEDDLFRVVLDSFPRVEGHVVLVYKPHREDISELEGGETGQVFQMCVNVVRAIKEALGAEKVYLLSMCDGPMNHLNFQLLPRYPGNLMGYRRLALDRRPLQHGKETAELIGAALLGLLKSDEPG